MILYILGNGFDPNKNDIYSGWQKRSISGVGRKSSVQHQRVAELDPQYRLVCYLGIQ